MKTKLTFLIVLFLSMGMVGCDDGDDSNHTKNPCREKEFVGRIVDVPYATVDYSEEYGYSILYNDFVGSKDPTDMMRFVPCPTPPKSEQFPNGAKVVVFGDMYRYDANNDKVIQLVNYEIQDQKEYETPYFNSIGEVVDIFELEYGKPKEIIINDEKGALKLVDVEDNFFHLPPPTFLPPNIGCGRNDPPAQYIRKFTAFLQVNEKNIKSSIVNLRSFRI